MFSKSAILFSLFAVDAFAASVSAVRNGIKPKRDADPSPSRLTKRATICSSNVTAPKIFIISMFASEANIWYTDKELDLLANNITVPGFSPLFPDAHCTASGEVCQLTTGEGEINAAATLSALWMSGCFDLTTTYFLVAGIAGISPHVGTTGSVTFVKYAVQVDLQYQFAGSQVPANYSSGSGYWPQHAYLPDESASPQNYPLEIYGTEVFELNDNLKSRFMYLSTLAKLNDTVAAQAYRATYGYAPASQPPSVIACDTATSNNYWSGSVLGDAFAQYTSLLTNGSGKYCTTAQEDNATLESLMRGALAGKLDFSRIAIMRTASDFDRAPPGETEVFHLLYAAQQGFVPSIQNIYLAGIEIVKDVLMYWDTTYVDGLKAGNYIGDLWNSLDSEVKPDIGTENIYLH